MAICTACNKPITDPYLVNFTGQSWHEKCVKCADCQSVLLESCFKHDTKIYCRLDFFKRVGVKCVGCENIINPNEVVRKIRDSIFHLDCFACSVCKKTLKTGQQLYILDNQHFLCREDYIKALEEEHPEDCGLKTNSFFDQEKHDISPNSTPSYKTSNVECGILTSPMPDGSTHSGSISSQNAKMDNVAFVNSEKDSASDKEDAHSLDDDPNNNKRRGPRTTIKPLQLDILKAAFLTTPKPTRNIREKLATETGLSMRVIQVWFQNRRSKERRLKKIGMGGSNKFFNRNHHRQPASLETSPDVPPSFNLYPSDMQDVFYGGIYLPHHKQEYHLLNSPTSENACIHSLSQPISSDQSYSECFDGESPESNSRQQIPFSNQNSIIESW